MSQPNTDPAQPFDALQAVDSLEQEFKVLTSELQKGFKSLETGQVEKCLEDARKRREELKTSADFGQDDQAQNRQWRESIVKISDGNIEAGENGLYAIKFQHLVKELEEHLQEVEACVNALKKNGLGETLAPDALEKVIRDMDREQQEGLEKDFQLELYASKIEKATSLIRSIGSVGLNDTTRLVREYVPELFEVMMTHLAED